MLNKLSKKNGLITIFVIGTAIRVVGLFSNKAMYIDEIRVWEVSKEHLYNLIIGNYGTFRHHPPLFYIFIHFWEKINTSELWLRIPSLVSSMVSIWLSYTISKKLFNKKVAFIVTFLYSVFTFHIIWSLQLRVYSTIFMFSLIYFYFFIQSINVILLKDWLITAIVGILAINIDYTFLWIYLPLNIHFLARVFRNKSPFSLYKKSLPNWLIHNVLICLFIIYYLFRILSLPPNLSLDWIPHPNISSLFILTIQFLQSDQLALFHNNFYLLIFNVISIFFLILLIRESFLGIKKYNLIILIIYVPLVTSFFISQFYSIFIARNLFVINFGIIILLSLRINKSKYRYKILLLLLWIVMNIISFSNFISNPGIEDWHSADHFIKSNIISKNKKIIFQPEWFASAYYYYYGYKNNVEPAESIPLLIKDKTAYCVIVRKSDANEGRIDINLLKILENYKVTYEKSRGILIYCD